MQQWMKLACMWWQDPKFARLSLAHKGLYASLLGYARYHNTGGSIPDEAIALCAYGARGRDKLVADLVKAGLLVRSSVGLAFPQSYYRWDSKVLQIPGQGLRSHAREEEKRREEKKALDLSISETQAQAREDSTSDSDKKWADIMNDLQSMKPVLIDGELCNRVDGQWVPINGSAR